MLRLAIPLLPLLAYGSAAAACAVPATADRVEAVTREGDLVLKAAGPVGLQGVRMPEEEPLREAVRARHAALAGLDVRRAGEGPADRWGRRAVRLQAEDRDVAAALIAEGLALVDPRSGEPGCVVALLALEDAARKRGLGLWAGDRYKPIPVAETARLQERIGRFTLVEGRIRSVGERQQQTFLNFSSAWSTDFTISIPKRTWTRLLERGLTAASLTGRQVRARGVIEARQGPLLTLHVPEMLEVVDKGRGTAR